MSRKSLKRIISTYQPEQPVTAVQLTLELKINLIVAAEVDLKVATLLDLTARILAINLTLTITQGDQGLLRIRDLLCGLEVVQDLDHTIDMLTDPEISHIQVIEEIEQIHIMMIDIGVLIIGDLVLGLFPKESVLLIEKDQQEEMIPDMITEIVIVEIEAGVVAVHAEAEAAVGAEVEAGMVMMNIDADLQEVDHVVDLGIETLLIEETSKDQLLRIKS